MYYCNRRLLPSLDLLGRSIVHSNHENSTVQVAPMIVNVERDHQQLTLLTKVSCLLFFTFYSSFN